MSDLTNNSELNLKHTVTDEIQELGHEKSKDVKEAAKEIKGIIGDYESFFLDLLQRLSSAGIDIRGMPISHICYRVGSILEYESSRNNLKAFSMAYAEHPFGGRPVSEFVLKTPLDLGQGYSVPMVELLPNKEARAYPKGLENIGVLVGNLLAEFRKRYESLLTGVKDRSPSVQLPFITFENGSTIKFYDRSLKEIVESNGFEFKSTL